MASVLIIDNDKILFEALQGCAEEIGIYPNHAISIQEGIRMINSGSYDVIIMRDSLPDGAACYAVEEIVSRAPSPEVIIYATQGGNPDEAEHALKCGVWDYVLDPSPAIEMPQLLKRALRYRESRLQEESERFDIPSQLSSHGIIGRSKATQHCLNLAARISQSDANVLITGESGTGKELFASAIHNFSSRSKKNLTIVDCAALPSSLVESILFGHARGSFTGADKAHIGLIKQSDGGTLFLDEIGELPLEIQKKFLRVIQERKYRPVGSSAEIKSNFRLIAATNKDLQEMAEQGNFREDLLFRLRTFHLELPPLRERSADITELAYFYRDDFCKRNKLKKKKFSPDYLMMLKQYDWPGNVRELFQAMERSITAAQDSTTLFPMHLPTNIRVQVTRKKLQQTNNKEEHVVTEAKAPYYEAAQELPPLKEAREQAIATEERIYLATLLKKTGGDIKKSCRISGLSRSRLYDLLKKYHLSAK